MWAILVYLYNRKKASGGNDLASFVALTVGWDLERGAGCEFTHESLVDCDFVSLCL